MITVHNLGQSETPPPKEINPILKWAIPYAIKDIQFRSAFSERSSVLTGEEIIAKMEGRDTGPPGVGSRSLRILKPTFDIESPTMGNFTIAPWGEALDGESGVNTAKLKWGLIAVGVGCIGIGMLVGKAIVYVSKKTLATGVTVYRRRRFGNRNGQSEV